MITIFKKPYLCSFTKNSIHFELKTDLQFNTATVFPELVLSFKAKPALGTTFNISFTNSENGRTETVNLVAVDGSNPSNYSEIWQIPDTSFSGSLFQLRNIVIEKLQRTAIFNSFYAIKLPLLEFSFSIPTITITAKEAIAELVMAWESSQPTAEINKYISEANSKAYHEPVVRDGYALKASLFLEKNYGSGNFSFVTAIEAVMDSESIAHVDVSSYLDSEIEASWTEYPLPYEQELGYKAPNLRRYYVEFSEEFANETEASVLTTEILYAHWGGASTDDAYNLDPVAAQNTNGQWLTWWPSGKRILKDQSDWLAWMNGAEATTFNVVCKIVTNFSEYAIVKHEAVSLLSFESFVFNSGFDANNLQNDVESGEIINNWSWQLTGNCEGCDTIKVTYRLVGEDPVTVEVGKENTLFNGKSQYLIPIQGYSELFPLRWFPSGGGAWYLNFPPTPSIAFFFGSNDCPFGDYTLFNAGLSIFEAFSVAPLSNCEITNGPTIFRYFPIENCLAQQILFFNSFGIPETFLLSGEFTQNITTSQELAVRTESFQLNNKLPQNYIFDSRNVISYNAETLMLSNLEAERLMPLINATITYLVEKNRFVPVVLNAGTTPIFKVNAFLQKIQVEMARANESDRVSYYEVLPDFEPVTNFSLGISTCTFTRNLLNITDFGNIKIYFEGAEIGTFTYDSSQKTYTGTPITQEGLLTFILNCEVNGVPKMVKKQLMYRWDEIVYELIGTEADIRFGTFLSSAPMRIDWNDGTTENVTIDNDGEQFTRTYPAEGKKVVRIFKPSFFDINVFVVHNAVNQIDVSKFLSLRVVLFENCVGGNFYFVGLKNLREVVFLNTNVHKLNIGYQKDLENVILLNTNISESNFEDFILEIWTFRKSYNNNFVIAITSEVVISPTAQSIIDATGIYAGDGLSTYSITIDLI